MELVQGWALVLEQERQTLVVRHLLELVQHRQMELVQHCQMALALARVDQQQAEQR